MGGMIKAVLFDVDGVLIDSFDANLKFYQDLFVKNGYKSLTRETFLTISHMTMIDVIKIVTKSKDESEINRIWKMGKDGVIPYSDNLLVSPQNYDLVIERLKEKYMLGIVTNRVQGHVFLTKQIAKYENYFKTVICYEDTKKHKPHPNPLLLAAKRLGITPQEAVYVGDTASDVEAAKGAHMKVILYSKDNLSDADAATSIFGNIPKLIKLINK